MIGPISRSSARETQQAHETRRQQQVSRPRFELDGLGVFNPLPNSVNDLLSQEALKLKSKLMAPNLSQEARRELRVRLGEIEEQLRQTAKATKQQDTGREKKKMDELHLQAIRRQESDSYPSLYTQSERPRAETSRSTQQRNKSRCVIQ
jgi:hypothetical protein